jgi:arabinofuranan 3-O-arabinosyltransferase
MSVTSPRHHLTAGVSRGAVALLALIAYTAALLTKPGRMPADTKLYLYLDPGRLISDAPFTWDPRQFGGWVPHQTVAYLWPQGPWYWAFDKLGLPDWVAHRLWIGSLLFLGGCGVLWVARILGLSRGGAVSAAAIYMLSPYVLPYVSRTSAMLLPWAALGWIVGLTIRSATSDRRWRYPALLGLVLVTCSAQNATALIMIAPAPLLWLVHAVVQHTITWRRALDTVARVGVLAVGVSLWWIAMLRAQGTWGADVLAYSESLQATSFTSSSTETLRGAGYWLFYVRDPYAFATTAARPYMESGRVILLGFGIVVTGLAGLALTRWSQRRYAALLLFVGIVLGVGVHPIIAPSPLMTPLAENSRSTLALALRSSTRALPMSNLALALGIGALVTAVGATRLRARSLAPAAVVVAAMLNLPALFDGGLVDPALERDQDPPEAWSAAADALSAGSIESRVLQLPGSEFGAFRWGYTVDPPLPGLTTKPLITRDLLPLGSPGLMDLLFALDDRVQNGVLDPSALAPVARLLGADTIWVANDLAFERFRTPRPEFAQEQIVSAPSMGSPIDFGAPTSNVPSVPMVDEQALVADRRDTAPLPPVQLVPVEDPSEIVRASDRVVVLVGSGDGLVDAAAAGLVNGDEAVIYAADLDSMPVGAEVDPALVILTDSNRDRARHWRGSQDVTGFTETGGPASDLLRPDEGDQRLPVFGVDQSADEQTTAILEDSVQVRASGYGEAFAYRPEDRPSMAVDGDPGTAWLVADRGDPIGHFITVSSTQGSLRLLQPQRAAANRRITSVRITPTDGAAEPFEVPLDDSSLTEPGQRVSLPTEGPISITITSVATNEGGTDPGPSAVGFAELGIGSHAEVVRLPRHDAPGSTARAVVLTRERTDPLDRWRSDPETAMNRSFSLSTDRSFTVAVQLRLAARARDELLNQLVGTTGPIADRRLTGDPWSRGVYAADGDVESAWTSPFSEALGSRLTFTSDSSALTTFTLRQPTDAAHSVITELTVSAGDDRVPVAVPSPDPSGLSTVTLPRPIRSGTITFVVTGIDARTTVDRRFGEITTLPVAIHELTATALTPSRKVDADAAGCRDDLLFLDGVSIPLRIEERDVQELVRGAAVDVTPCSSDSLRMSLGEHLVTTASGLRTGLDIDRITLASGQVPPAARPPEVSVTRTRTSRTATVAPCPDGCWLVMGEGLNSGWSASTEDADLGTPVQIAGGMNGWWLPPNTASTVVRIEWQAQRAVTIALLLTAVAVAICVALAVGRRRSRAEYFQFTAEPPRIDRSVVARGTWRHTVVSCLVLVLLAALVASPTAALWASIPAAAMLATRRPRVSAAASTMLMALLATTVVQRQLVSRAAAGPAWILQFSDLHRAGMLVVVLLLAGALSGDGRSDPASGSAPARRPR